MKDWTTIYKTEPIEKLKHIGHSLLDEYIALDGKRKGRNAVEHAYQKLGGKLNTMYGMHHFGKMKTRAEVVSAIIKLRRMITQRKKNNQWKKETKESAVFLPSDEMKKALAKLKSLTT